MKKIIALLITLFFLHGLSAQIDSSARSANFAIVDLFSRNPNYWDHCVAKYDNGDLAGMDKIFSIPANPEYKLAPNEMDSVEFRILDYFYKKGFDLLTVGRESRGAVRFYFKRKGL